MRLPVPKVDHVPADLTRAEDVRELVIRTAERFGGLDVLVTNAGGPTRWFLRHRLRWLRRPRGWSEAEDQHTGGRLTGVAVGR